ncbi:MAG: sodium:solute symporter [Sediminibacterium sp.]|nr:sodium:solute symporter [Sediminibacterium sp.]
MTPVLILSFIGVYFLLLMGIGWYTSRQSNASSYFIGNKASPWYLVAFGMIGDSLSGVTYISVPGKVDTAHFSYLQVVLGYFLGYFVISSVLLPLYYRMNLLSIYEYLKSRFGKVTQKTGALFFIISRLLGAAARLYLAANVIQLFVFDQFTTIRIPFALSVSVILALMLLYTYRGGIKTLVYTDTLQSLFLVLGVVLSIAAIISKMDSSLWQACKNIIQSDKSTIWVSDFRPPNFVLKDIIGGLFIAVAMTGLDQNMMQKNLSCKSLQEAQKNMKWFSVVMLAVNVFFLCLGVLIYQYYAYAHIPLPGSSDKVFPNLALNHLGLFAGLVFIVGLTAATFSSADSVLTTLTTSAYVDLLELDRKPQHSETQTARWRTGIHIGFAVLLWLIILVFYYANTSAVIDTVLKVAGYTYGPLLALFGIGLFTKWNLRDQWVPVACILGPLTCYWLNQNSQSVLGNYKIGTELIVVNAVITLLFLVLLKRREIIPAKH